MRCVKIKLSGEQELAQKIKHIERALQEITAGQTAIKIAYTVKNLSCDLDLPSATSIQLDETSADILKKCLPDASIEYIYD